MPSTSQTLPESAPASKRKQKGVSVSKNGSSGAGTRTGHTLKGGADRLPGGLAETTSRVVFQAASILEEEIAAGIVAAKQVEGRLTKSDAAPSASRNTLMKRFRRDLHEVIDMILDVVDVAVDYADRQSPSAKGPLGTSPRKSSSPASNGQVGIHIATGSVKAGESVAIAMKLENNVDTSTGEFGFLSSDLVSASGDRIAAAQVEFSPAVVSIEPHQTEEVTIAVSVPQGKPAGSYAGVIQTTRVGQPQALLIVEVG